MVSFIDLIVGLFILALPVLAIIFIVLIFAGMKIVMEYEKGVRFTLGRFSGIMQPGLNYIIPIIQSWVRIDTRIITLDIPGQEVMTKDNIPVNINAVMYFRVIDPKRAILNVSDYVFAVSKYGQTSMRDVVGETELDELLSKRDQVAEKVKNIVDIATEPWGIDISHIKLQDIELPADMKRIIARQAEAERERRGVIIKAEGEVIASKNLAKAAQTLTNTKGALHLRTLETISDVSQDQSNTILVALPIEILRAIEGFAKKEKSSESSKK
jgi:regulator of protease activity HflC (stomatin/prohibitin superfamily)